MAQTKRKRRRKHRGTPAGTVERPARGGRSQTTQDPKQATRERRQARLDREPTWRGAVNRAAVAALVLGALLLLILEYSLQRTVPVVLLMFLLYIPLGYLTDRAIYRFRRRRRG